MTSSANLRLDPHCHILALDDGALVRRGSLSWRLDGRERAALLLRLVERLDGREAEAVFAGLPAGDMLGALALLEELRGAGLLVTPEPCDVEHAPREPTRSDNACSGALAGQPDLVAPLTDKRSVALTGQPDLVAPLADKRSVALTGQPDLVARLAGALDSAGVCSTEHPEGSTPARADLWILILDGPDWTRIDEFDQLAASRGQAWLPAFVLAGDRVAGPVIVPGRSACAGCLELRWLGMSPAVALERALFADLRRGGWRREAGDPVAGAALVRACAGLAIDWLGERARPGSLDFTPAEGGPSRRATVHRHPDCERCGEGPPTPSPERVLEYWQRAEGPAPSLDALASSLAPLCDDRVGLVGELHGGEPTGASGRATAHARFALPRPLEVGRSQSNTSCGMAPSARSAERIAMIEGLERHCMIASVTPSCVAPYARIRDDALHPPALPLYSPAQHDGPALPFARFDPSADQEWVWVYNVSRRRPVLVPRTAVWPARPNEGALLSETSSGVAAHGTRTRALLGGLLELIERDAFMIFWLHRLAPPRIELDSLPPGFAPSVVAELDAAGYRPTLLDATTDLGVPVVFGAATREDGRGPALLFGAGAALTPHAALESALGELVGALRGVQQTPDWRPSTPLAPEQIRALADHSKAYAHPSWLPKAAFLWSSPSVRPFAAMSAVAPASTSTSPSVALELALERLAAHELELFAADLAVPEVAAAGLHVVRAIVPGLQPIGFGRHGIRLGGRRLYSAAAAMGYDARREADLNLDPHCFP